MFVVNIDVIDLRYFIEGLKVINKRIDFHMFSYQEVHCPLKVNVSRDKPAHPYRLIRS